MGAWYPLRGCDVTGRGGVDVSDGKNNNNKKREPAKTAIVFFFRSVLVVVVVVDVVADVVVDVVAVGSRHNESPVVSRESRRLF